MVKVSSPDNSAKVKRFLPLSAQAHYRKQEAIRAANGEANYARSQQRESEKPELQHLYSQLQAAVQHPKRDNAIEKELQSQIDEIKARWAADDAEWEAKQKDFMNTATPSAMAILEPWVRLDLKSRQTAFNFTEALPEGQTPRGMVDLCREAHKPLAAKHKAIIGAPQTAEEIAAVIAATVANTGQKSLLNLNAAKHLDFDRDKNRFKPRNFGFPSLAIFDGVGATLKVPDAFGLMCLLWPSEITDRLTALATGGEADDAVRGAMDRAERGRALDDVDAEILANARRGEFWIRVCQSKNVAAGPRFTEDPRAILDLA